MLCIFWHLYSKHVPTCTRKENCNNSGVTSNDSVNLHTTYNKRNTLVYKKKGSETVSINPICPFVRFFTLSTFFQMHKLTSTNFCKKAEEVKDFFNVRGTIKRDIDLRQLFKRVGKIFLLFTLHSMLKVNFISLPPCATGLYS